MLLAPRLTRNNCNHKKGPSEGPFLLCSLLLTHIGFGVCWAPSPPVEYSPDRSELRSSSVLR
jgi:hypothetical protein